LTISIYGVDIVADEVEFYGIKLLIVMSYFEIQSYVYSNWHAA